MVKAVLDRLIFLYSRAGTILVMSIVALIMCFSFYIYFGFEQLVAICFMYLFPICICLQAISLIVTEGNKFIPCILTLVFYSITFTLVLDSSCLFYLIPYSILYLVMYFILRLFKGVHKHKVEDIHYVEDLLIDYEDSSDKIKSNSTTSENNNDDLWLDF